MDRKEEKRAQDAFPRTNGETHSPVHDAVSDPDGSGQRRCRRCLLREMDQGEYFKNLYAYIDGLEEDVRAAETIYQDRLACCRQCDLLVDGMCRACGCFVELRAAIDVNRCPYGKW